MSHLLYEVFVTRECLPRASSEPRSDALLVWPARMLFIECWEASGNYHTDRRGCSGQWSAVIIAYLPVHIQYTTSKKYNSDRREGLRNLLSFDVTLNSFIQ